MPGLDKTTIYICTIHIHICALAKPGFCSGGRISCKPKNGALLSTSTHKNDDSKSPIIVHCLAPVRNNDNKSTGAGMDVLSLLLAVIIVTFIIQLLTSVTTIATMVLIIVIRIRTIIQGRVIVTAAEIEIVVTITVIMIVLLIVLIKAIVLNLILVKE